MTRRVELGAGMGASILAVFGFLVLLYAPLVPYCSVGHHPACASGEVRYTSALHAGLSAGAWGFVIALLLLTLVGSLGAVLEAGYGWQGGLVLLWPGTVLAFAVCAVAAGGAGILYLPAVLALCLATYASVLYRLRLRRTLSTDTVDMPPETEART